MSHIKTCDYCNNRIVKEDRPFEVKGGFLRWGNVSREMTYDLCLTCRTLLATFKKSTVNDLIKSKHQQCCTKIEDNCCEDHYPDDYEHECLEDIPPIVLE